MTRLVKKGLKEVVGEAQALVSVEVEVLEVSKVIIVAVLEVAGNIKIFTKILIIRGKILLKCSGCVENLPPFRFHRLSFICSQ